MPELQNYKFRPVTLYQVDIWIDEETGFGVRSVEATKIVDEDGHVSYAMVVEKNE